jgi:serine O-acetyltransferase
LVDLPDSICTVYRWCSVFDNIREDWRAHDCQLARHGFWVLVVYRFGRWRYKIQWRPLRMPFSLLYKLMRFVSEMLLGVELPSEVVIGRRFVIEHIGGIVISGDARFGDDCVIRNGVTVGLRNRGVAGSPHIGDRVDIGAGAKLLGAIRIGDDCAIGANAVVLCDVPARSIAVGVPARILPRHSLQTPLESETTP